MKMNFKLLLLLLSVTFISCDKKDDSSSPASSISSDGVISGIIVNYSSKAMDSIKSDGYSVKNPFDKCAVFTGGKFSISLSIPELRKLGSAPQGVIVGDTAVLIATVEQFHTYKNGLKTGQIVKCNFTTDSVETAGMSTSLFIYADRKTTITGTETESSTSQTYTNTETITYDVKLNKGWNEVVTRIDVHALTDTSRTTKQTITSTITSDLQWRYFEGYEYFGVKKKTKVVLKSFGLFR